MRYSERHANISLSGKQIYIALQAISEAQDRLSENDIKTIMNADREDLEDLLKILSEKLTEFKG